MLLLFGSKIPLLGSCINLQVGMSSDVYTYIFMIWKLEIKCIVYPSGNLKKEIGNLLKSKSSGMIKIIDNILTYVRIV